MTRPRPCPVCRRPVPPRPANRAWPFCSERCRLLDLGRWLGEEYRVAGPPAGDGAAGTAGPADEGDDA
ncbi:MAG TPA: DNA gyrase inhibitor YacG [Anaeromyxobacteraceae bacterium]|nr:DNA gyrase inhibitor YacG [Anaeromyxobacteraceae bacterium]